MVVCTHVCVRILITRFNDSYLSISPDIQPTCYKSGHLYVCVCIDVCVGIPHAIVCLERCVQKVCEERRITIGSVCSVYV